MALEIPLFDNPYYTINIKVDGVVLFLTFKWSTREQSWYFSVFDGDNNPLMIGIKLMPFADLTLKHPNTKMPPGVLYCVSITSDLSPPGRFDLSERIKLYYLTASDLA